MTRTVYKYTLDLNLGNIDPVLTIPGGGHFLHLKEQTFDGKPSRLSRIDTWWAVETDNVPVEVQLHIRGTGDVVPPSVNYLGTAFLSFGLVLHVWQKDQVFQDMHIVDGKFVSRSQ